MEKTELTISELEKQNSNIIDFDVKGVTSVPTNINLNGNNLNKETDAIKRDIKDEIPIVLSTNEIEIENNYKILENLFDIIKNILTIADKNMIELLVDDEIFLITFGALEYDKDSIKSKKFKKHRKFLKEQANFNNILNIKNDKILSIIHMNFRLTYLKDIAIGRFIEENTTKVVNQLIYYNNVELIHYIIVNKSILKSMIERIKSDNIIERNEGIRFLNELNLIAKDLVLL